MIIIGSLCLAVDERDSCHPPDLVAKAQSDSNQKSSASQEEVGENQQSRPIEIRGSTFEADLVDCTSEGACKLVLSLPAPDGPSDTNARPEALPSCPADSGDHSETVDPVNELPDPSRPQPQDPSESDEESASRDKEAPLLYTHFFLK